MMNNRSFFLCTLIFSLLVTKIHSYEPFYLCENQEPNAVVATNDATVTDTEYDGDSNEKLSIPALTFYPALNVNSNRNPVILICPDKGSDRFAIDKESYSAIKEFQTKGISAFVLKHRTASEQTMNDKTIDPLEDVQQALMLLRSNAAKWNINPNKIGVMGFSAGGHLASIAATHFHHPVIGTKGVSVRPDFMILIYPGISSKDSLTYLGLRNNVAEVNPSKELINLYSNEDHISEDTPPAFVVHTEGDQSVGVMNSLRFYEKLNEKGVKSELVIYPEGGQGFGLNNNTTRDKWLDACLSWLDNYILGR